MIKPSPELLRQCYLFTSDVPIELIELSDLSLLEELANGDNNPHDLTMCEIAEKVIAAGNETYYK